MEDLIALVDINDRITGYETKGEVHRRGLLHRAFSVFIVRDGTTREKGKNCRSRCTGG